MTIRDLLIKYLLADSTIAGMVDTRIYPLLLPQKATMPAITVTRISNTPIEQLNGRASADEPRYQIDAWATTQKAVDDVSGAIRAALESFVGTWADVSSPGVSTFVQVRFVTDRDGFEEDILGGLCRKSADYFVFHRRSIGMV